MIVKEKITHNEFAKKVREEWNLPDNESLTQNWWNIYYQYTLMVKGERKVIGNFDGRFHLYNQSGGETIYELA